MKKREVQKGHTFSVRMPEKTRYGLDLLARKHHTQISAIVIKAVDALLEAEGLTTRQPGELFSTLDKLWSESGVARLLARVEHTPELATVDEKRIYEAMQAIRERYRSVSERLAAPAINEQGLTEIYFAVASYLGLMAGSSLPTGDEKALLDACDLAVLNANPEIASQCGSLEQFRLEYLK